jgi:hypothetical protein
MSHLDVVPVPEENLADWKFEPFSGEISEGKFDRIKTFSKKLKKKVTFGEEEQLILKWECLAF